MATGGQGPCQELCGGTREETCRSSGPKISGNRVGERWHRDFAEVLGSEIRGPKLYVWGRIQMNL